LEKLLEAKSRACVGPSPTQNCVSSAVAETRHSITEYL